MRLIEVAVNCGGIYLANERKMGECVTIKQKNRNIHHINTMYISSYELTTPTKMFIGDVSMASTRARHTNGL